MNRTREVPLSEICRPRQWRPLPAREMRDSGYPVYGANGVVGYYDTFTHETPTIAVGCRGTIGSVHVSEGKAFITSNAMALDALRDDLVDIRYLASFLSWRGFGDVVSGSSQPQLTGAGLARIRVPLPPIEEQQRIAAILDQADAIRTKRHHQMSATQALIRSHFRRLIESEDTNAGWRRTKVEDLGEVKLGRQRAPKYQSGKHTRPYMRVANVQFGYLDLNDVLSMDFDERDFAEYQLEPGDILLNEGQSTELVGRPAMWHGEIPGCCFQNTLLRFRSDSSVVDSQFMLHLFMSYMNDGTFAKLSSKTSNVAHLGKARLAALVVPVPPLDQQRRFGELSLSVNAAVSKSQAAAASADTLFASLQARAFRGEL